MQESGLRHEEGVWNAMLAPLLNTTATGGVWYSGQYDVDNNIRLDKANCSLTGVIASWRKEADLKTVGYYEGRG